jgi:hypothetical protein
VTTPAERAAERRAETARIEARNHAAGLHPRNDVQTCQACIEQRAKR